MKFSQRIGKMPVKTVLQVESMDDDLKNGLWNVIKDDCFDNLNNWDFNQNETDKGVFCLYLWKEFFKKTTDSIPKNFTQNVETYATIDFFREWYFSKALWFEIYDFIEFMNPTSNICEKFNKVLEKEVSAYRIINGQVTQITSEGEIAEIEEALTASDQWQSVNTHLGAALNFLADRKNPDYRNSIKESISAVEALCLKLGGNANGKFGDALTEIEKKIQLHGSLKVAFKALYGYTSDEGGIRHALTDEGTTPTFEDAKFMLVSCSAFINYLKAKMQL